MNLVAILTGRPFTGLLAVLLLGSARDLHGETPEAPDYSALQKRVEELMGRLAEAAQTRAMLQTATESLPSPKSDEIERMMEEVRQLKTEEQRATHRLDLMIKEDMPASLSVADLERKLDVIRKERDALVEKITLLKKPKKPEDPSAPPGIPGTVLRTNLKPIGVKLVKNRVVPLESPYFSATRVQAINRQTKERLTALKIHRVKDGTAVTDAIQSGDMIDKLIKEANASKNSHFFVIQVCADSIPAYQTLVSAVMQRGYDYMWDTAKDADWFIPETGGGGRSSGGPIRVFSPDGR